MRRGKREMEGERGGRGRGRREEMEGGGEGETRRDGERHDTACVRGVCVKKRKFVNSL